jgi:flagellar biosynthesis/type III secretory pathway protein FliH
MASPLDIVLPLRLQRIEKLDPFAKSGGTTHDAGFDAGYRAGRLRAEWEARREREQNDAKVRALVTKLEGVHHDYEKLLEEHLPDLIQGALGRVFRNHPFTATEIGNEIAALLRDMDQAGRITLECAPAELDALKQELEDHDAVPTGMRWTLTANTSLLSGEFLLKTDLGDVDGRHSTRIRQIHHALGAKS